MQGQFSHGLFEDVGQIIQQRDQCVVRISELENQCNQMAIQANSMLHAKDQTISQLTAQIASLKSISEHSPRTFSTDANGKVRSNEPNGNHKEIGIFKLKCFYIFVVTTNRIPKFYIHVIYWSGINSLSSAFVPIDKISKGNLMQYFTSFKRECSKSLANEFLYDMLMRCIQSEDIRYIIIPEFPGLTLNKENGKIKSVAYTCCSSQFPDFIKPYISAPYQSKMLPMTNKLPEEIAEAIIPYLKSPSGFVLMTFRLTGLLSTYLDDIHLMPSMISVISSHHPDSEALACSIIKTYNCHKPPTSLTISKTELTRILNESKDETVVFIDDTTSESKVKRSSSLDVICSERSNEAYKPHLTAILSKTIQHQLPSGRALVLEIDENFGTGISTAERNQLCDDFNAMTRIFIDTFCAHFSDYDQKLQTWTAELKKEVNELLPTEDSKNTFAVLYSVLRLWCCIFHTTMPDNMKEFLLALIQNSLHTEKGNSAAIINEFSRVLNHALSAGIIDIRELNRDMCFTENQNMIIHDGELLLAEESTMKNVFLPQITTASTVNSILTALKEEDLLVATNGHRKPTTVYDENKIPQQKKLIAFKFQGIVNTDVLQYIESQKIKQYFRDDVHFQNFVPLIQNYLGHTAGQVLTTASNQHRFITGKSGSGKTVFLIQLLYHLHRTGNHIVAFDANSSFTKEKLIECLPEDFISNHITFHSIEEDGVPVNLFHTYDTDKPLARRKMLCNILGEVIHNPSQNQELALKNIVKKMMLQTDSPTYIDLLEQFENAEDISEKSIAGKLYSVFEETIDSGMETTDDWSAFLNKCKEIVIISMEESLSENGDQLTDMLLASLYYAQRHETEPHQLSILIDEIQNQNLSENSVISKLLKEGRKYLIDMNFATQYVNDIKQNRMLKQAGISVYFQPDLASRASVANMLGLKKSEIYKLGELHTGECFIQGTIYNFETNCPEESIISGTTALAPDSPLRKATNS